MSGNATKMISLFIAFSLLPAVVHVIPLAQGAVEKGAIFENTRALSSKNALFSTVHQWRIPAIDSTKNQRDWSDARQPHPTTTDLTPHDPIYIDGNDDFTSANGVTGGSGTEDDPWIIEGWEINASSAHGIYIRNTTDYFVIRNCLIKNGVSFSNNGIFLDDVRNGGIENTTTDNNNCGIYLEYSDNNTLSNNTVANNFGLFRYGIYLKYSDNNTLTNNAVSNNFDGIFLELSDNNILDNNTTLNNRFDGISLGSSANNTLTRTTALYNNQYGISLSFSDSNILTGNVLKNNHSEGVYSYGSNYNTLNSNTMLNNSEYGISLRDSKYDTFTGNIISGSDYGIYLWRSDNNTLSNNIARKNSIGIYLRGSNSNIIYNNYFSDINNAYDGGNNTWNIDPPIPEKNIVGGPYIGGNYWSDYAGVDLDGDYLGDTEVPYNSSGEISHGGDYFPLIFPVCVQTHWSGLSTYPMLEIRMWNNVYDNWYTHENVVPKRNIIVGPAFGRGLLQSSVFDALKVVCWDNVEFVTVGLGTANVYMRFDNDNDPTDKEWTRVENGASLNIESRYMQYELELIGAMAIPNNFLPQLEGEPLYDTAQQQGVLPRKMFKGIRVRYTGY